MNRRTLIGMVAASSVAAGAARGEDAPTVSIDYDLGHDGWSNFTLHVGAQSTDVGPVSYTTDALDDLILTAIEAALGVYHITASFDGEPNETRLVIDESYKPTARLRILSFSDIYEHLPDDKGRVEFEARIRLDDYARAVQAAAHKIWDTYGEDGYRQAWDGQRGFPVRALRALDAALADK